MPLPYNIFFDPVNIRLFGVAGVMLDSDGVAHLVQEFFGAAFHVLCSKDSHERSKVVYMHQQTLIVQDNSVYNNGTSIYMDIFRIYIVRLHCGSEHFLYGAKQC